MQNIAFKDIIDTTFRDGQQSPLLFDTYKYRFHIEEKKLLLKGLIELGIRYFEFFSPVVSRVEKNDFITLKAYGQTLTNKPLHFLAHCRCHPADIEEAVKAGFNGLNLYISVTKQAQKYSLGKTKKGLFDLIITTIRTTRNKYPNLYLRFSIEDAFRTALADICEIYDQIAPLVQTLGIPDTVGIASPEMVTKRITALKKRYPKNDLECHFHNDRGLALVNSITAIESGASYVDASIWGLAERSGIPSVTGIIFNLQYLKTSLVKKYHRELCYPLNVLMGSILKTQVPYNEPVSLTNRTHTAGVHQKAVLGSHKTYEAHGLEQYGVTKKQLFLGPLSGWNLIYYYLKEMMGYEVSKEEAKEIALIFKNQSEKISKRFNPEKLLKQILRKYPLPKITVPKELQKTRIENLEA